MLALLTLPAFADEPLKCSNKSYEEATDKDLEINWHDPATATEQYCTYSAQLATAIKAKNRLAEIEKASGVVNLRSRYDIGTYEVRAKHWQAKAARCYKFVTKKTITKADCKKESK